MKKKTLVLFCLLVCAISSAQITKDKKSHIYTNEQLILFLDSIGKLNPTKLVKKINKYSDSLFYKPQVVLRKVSKANMKNLKYHDLQNFRNIDNKFIIALFGKSAIKIYDPKDDIHELEFFHFGNQKNKYKEFAVKIGNHVNCEIYFFNNNSIIGHHHYENKYPLNIKYYTNNNGRTVIYYNQDYDYGTGVNWLNTYFYQYSSNKIIPILNEINESNLSGYWGFRSFSLNTKIIKTNPLTIKMDYGQYLSDSLQNSINVVSGSTKIKYTRRNKYNKLIGDYNDNQLNKNHILTYYTRQNTDILFINTYYKQLKSLLLDEKKKPIVFQYLNKVKNLKLI